MRAVVTRVSRAQVTIDGASVGKIGQGFLVLLGITHEDTQEQVERLAEKICACRVFEDEDGKMNRSLADVGGALLVVSQFTLYAGLKKGRRPDFMAAARPETAIPLYEAFLEACTKRGFPPAHGEFGADMQVSSINDGPVTLIYDTAEL